MVLSHLASRLGLWDYVAPPPASKSKSKPTQKTSQHQQQEENQDSLLAHKMQQEENIRSQRLETQHELETKAGEINQFSKWQRVLYYSKIDDLMIEAVVVGVHFDDGPDKPYYVSDDENKYKSFCVFAYCL